jgi:hypothetical protein
MNIDEICEYYGIKNYTINPDGSIDVDGNVHLHNRKLTKLPLKFNKVTGDFNCFWNNLTTLEGSPTYVSSWFDCSYNELTSLEGCPNYVDNFVCSDNPLPQEILNNPKAELTRLNREKKLNYLLITNYGIG